MSRGGLSTSHADLVVLEVGTCKRRKHSLFLTYSMRTLWSTWESYYRRAVTSSFVAKMQPKHNLNGSL